ncbi:hypothetical protein LEMLEM_LOCUS6440 [Lemmus lemmus]
MLIWKKKERLWAWHRLVKDQIPLQIEHFLQESHNSKSCNPFK